MMSAATELFPVPVYTTIGNHDAWNSGAAAYASYYGPYTYSFVYKDAKFVFLDTSSGIVGETQFDWLEGELADGGHEHLFVFTHMPPVDTVTGEFDAKNTLHPESLYTIHSKNESDYFLRIMDDYGVDVVFAGHTHVHGDVVLNGTRYVTSGVMGGSVKPGDTIGYLDVTVDGDSVDVEFVDVLSVEAAEALGSRIQAIRVFTIPFMINNSVRIALTLALAVIASLTTLGFRRRLVVRVGPGSPGSASGPAASEPGRDSLLPESGSGRTGS